MSNTLARALPILAGALCAALAPVVVADDISTRAGAVTVYHQAFPAVALTPEIAQRFGFQRERHLAILNVTVVTDRPGGAGQSGTALVEAQIVAPDSLRRPIPMREIRDGDAISYMGGFPVGDPATLDFEIRVRPAGASELPTIRMSQELFAQ